MKTLIIVRHGNTFLTGEPARRVGRRTDLPLVETDRARGAARCLRSLGCLPDKAFAAPLQRTLRTAELVLEELGLTLPVRPAPDFSEIDYGPDENQEEQQLKLRLGRVQAQESGVDPESLAEEALQRRGEGVLALWNEKAIPPPGWQVDPNRVAADWKRFADGIAPGESVLLVSSNGVIRFAPHLLPERERLAFADGRSLKVTTGGVCIFTLKDGVWHCPHWNISPLP